MTSTVSSFLLQWNYHSVRRKAQLITKGTHKVPGGLPHCNFFQRNTNPTIRSLKVYNGNQYFSDKQRRYLQSHPLTLLTTLQSYTNTANAPAGTHPRRTNRENPTLLLTWLVNSISRNTNFWTDNLRVSNYINPKQLNTRKNDHI